MPPNSTQVTQNVTTNHKKVRKKRTSSTIQLAENLRKDGVNAMVRDKDGVLLTPKVEKIDKKYYGLVEAHEVKKKDIIVQYAEDLKASGDIQMDMISTHIARILKEFTTQRYVTECLGDEFKNKQMQENRAGRTSSTKVSNVPLVGKIQEMVQHAIDNPPVGGQKIDITDPNRFYKETIDAKNKLISELREEIADKDKKIAELEKEIAALKKGAKK